MNQANRAFADAEARNAGKPRYQPYPGGAPRHIGLVAEAVLAWRAEIRAAVAPLVAPAGTSPESAEVTRAIIWMRTESLEAIAGNPHSLRLCDGCYQAATGLTRNAKTAAARIPAAPGCAWATGRMTASGAETGAGSATFPPRHHAPAADGRRGRPGPVAPALRRRRAGSLPVAAGGLGRLARRRTRGRRREPAVSETPNAVARRGDLVVIHLRHRDWQAGQAREYDDFWLGQVTSVIRAGLVRLYRPAGTFAWDTDGRRPAR